MLSNALWSFDPDYHAWANLSGLQFGEAPKARSSMGMAALGGFLYVMGGFAQPGECAYCFSQGSQIELHHTDQNLPMIQHSFCEMDEVPDLSMLAALLLYDKPHKIPNGSFLGDFVRFSVNQMKWEPVPMAHNGNSTNSTGPVFAFPSARCAHGMVAAEDKLFLFGGFGMSGD